MARLRLTINVSDTYSRTVRRCRRRLWWRRNGAAVAFVSLWVCAYTLALLR